MASNNLLNKAIKIMGAEESAFNEVHWLQDEVKDLPLTIDDLLKDRDKYAVKLFNFDFDETTKTLQRENNFFHNLTAISGKITYMYKKEYGSEINPEEPYWEGRVKASPNKFIEIDNLQLITNHDGHVHTHQVLKNLSFHDIAIKLRFEKKNGSEYFHTIPLPAVQNYKAYVGVEGTRNQQRNSQIGIKQSYLYYLKIGNKYLGIKLEVSIVLMYAGNDFEPLGVIDAAKFFPQVKFSSNSVDLDDLLLYPENKLMLPQVDPKYNAIVLTGLPSDVDVNSCRIHSYKARVKMTANNNNSQHVDLKENSSGKWIDQNHFKRVRKFGLPIPDMFEKYFDADLSMSNLPGFFTDSNSSNKDQRKFPRYHIASENPPTWAYIFDYAKTGITKEYEIQATYGLQDKNEQNKTLFKNERSNTYKYPPNNIDNNIINLVKKARQGEYDNIHLHGYMGKYADNNLPVIHAPICGFCCFHLHWRWAPLNYDLNTSKVYKTIGLAKGDPTRFNGWDMKGFNDGSNFGKPLIPPNQSLKIAVTNENAVPYNADVVVNPNQQSRVLDNNVKTVWYSVDILDTSSGDNGYVVLEQGAGFAFRYSEDVERVFKNMRTNIANIVGGVDRVTQVFLLAAMHLFDTPDLFEISYRLMRVYNIGQYSNVEQIPQGDYKPESTKPSMEKL